MNQIDPNITERDDGCIVVAEPTVFKPLDRFDPPKRQELVVLLDDPKEGELVRDFAEWDGKRWRYVGDFTPVVVPVKYFAELCTLPIIQTDSMEVAA
jgi:hypothetical protein